MTIACIRMNKIHCTAQTDLEKHSAHMLYIHMANVQLLFQCLRSRATLFEATLLKPRFSEKTESVPSPVPRDGALEFGSASSMPCAGVKERLDAVPL